MVDIEIRILQAQRRRLQQLLVVEMVLKAVEEVSTAEEVLSMKMAATVQVIIVKLLMAEQLLVLVEQVPTMEEALMV